MATHPRNPAMTQGLRVLICRPEPEATQLAGYFRQAGDTPLLLPMLAREPLPETPEQRALIQDLDLFTHVIAVSPYAARQLLARIDPWWPQMPVGVNWYGVGASTAAILEQAGLHPRMPADGWTSEALLALPELAQLTHERVLIARGEDGRELMRTTLTERGARVSVLPLYRRYRPTYTPEQVRQRLGDSTPDVIIVLSGETLNNLIALGQNSVHNLRNALLVVPAQRIADQAQRAGFQHTLVPENLTHPNLVTSVHQWPAFSAKAPETPSKDTRD